MNTRTKIKVIKKGTEKVIQTPVAKNNTPEPGDASKLASIVSNWIAESQSRRRQERESAIVRFNS